MIKWIKSILFKIKNYDKVGRGSTARERARIKKDLLPLLNGNREKQLKQYVNDL